MRAEIVRTEKGSAGILRTEIFSARSLLCQGRRTPHIAYTTYWVMSEMIYARWYRKIWGLCLPRHTKCSGTRYGGYVWFDIQHLVYTTYRLCLPRHHKLRTEKIWAETFRTQSKSRPRLTFDSNVFRGQLNF